MKLSQLRQHHFAYWIATGLLVMIPAFLALFKYASQELNADIILNQIMALHNPTLFYWGQNRILNVIPFILQFVHSPILNLFLVLFITACSFFLLLWFLACLAVKISCNKSLPATILLIYIASICLCIALFKYDAWVSFCIWHFEYSLALLLGLLNIYAVYFCNRYYASASYLAVFLATGINPAMILVIIPIIFFHCWHIFKISLKDIICFTLWIAFFIIWIIISKSYGSYENYSSLIPKMYGLGVENFIINLFKEYIIFGRFLLIFLVMTICYTLYLTFGKQQFDCRFQKQMTLYAIIASVCITGFISCIRWYHMNGFSPRYFSFMIYAFIFIFDIWFIKFIINIYISKKNEFILSVIGLCVAFWFFYPAYFNLYEVNAYKRCNKLVQPGNNFYVGNYWEIWECASRDINLKFDSHALGFRSDSNKNNILHAATKRYTQEGKLNIYCLNADLKICKKQLDEFFKDYSITGITKVNDKNLQLQLQINSK